MDPKQFSLPRKSTTHALVDLLHSVLAALESGQYSVRIFFADFRKGFDLADHNIIIEELRRLEVHPSIVRWIYDFLTDREQCVKIDNSYSSWKKNNGGLPQGTKLGPILFAILVNQLLNNWQGRIKFVDDSTAFEIIPRGSPSLLPIVVDEISEFAMERGMELNPKKCKEMIITFLKYNHTCFSPIYVGGVPIELVSTFKLLGVQLTKDVTWNVHVNYIIKKANS